MTFDALVSQFGLMFFIDRLAALREMSRLLRPHGRLADAVPDSVERSPGYAALVNLLDRLFGKPLDEGLRSPFALGDADRRRGLAAAGIADAGVAQHQDMVRFTSVAPLLSTDRACVWTLGGKLDASRLARLRDAAAAALQPFVAAAGSVVFALPAPVLTAPEPPRWRRPSPWRTLNRRRRAPGRGP